MRKGRVPLRTVLQNFIDHVDNIENQRIDGEDLYEKEFQELKAITERLKTEPGFECSHGERDENRSKNRYKDILPYDYTRVVLAPLPGGGGDAGDYINANYIKGAGGSHAYIACQGPLPCTLDDFWRMVVQCEVQVIVMASNETEGGKHKCQCYWACEAGERRQFGAVSVSFIKSRQVCPDFLVRTLQITYPSPQGGTESRVVCQFHYSLWPDHGVPESVKPLLAMVRLVRECQASETLPLLVHCSAGCGRTGTICAIDHVWTLLRTGRLPDSVDLLSMVKEMRRQRVAMVQTRDQYVLLHRAVRHLFKDRLALIDEHPYANICPDGSPLGLCPATMDVWSVDRSKDVSSCKGGLSPLSGTGNNITDNDHHPVNNNDNIAGNKNGQTVNDTSSSSAPPTLDGTRSFMPSNGSTADSFNKLRELPCSPTSGLKSPPVSSPQTPFPKRYQEEFSQTDISPSSAAGKPSTTQSKAPCWYASEKCNCTDGKSNKSADSPLDEVDFAGENSWFNKQKQLKHQMQQYKQQQQLVSKCPSAQSTPYSTPMGTPQGGTPSATPNTTPNPMQGIGLLSPPTPPTRSQTPSPVITLNKMSYENTLDREGVQLQNSNSALGHVNSMLNHYRKSADRSSQRQHSKSEDVPTDSTACNRNTVEKKPRKSMELNRRPSIQKLKQLFEVNKPVPPVVESPDSVRPTSSSVKLSRSASSVTLRGSSLSLAGDSGAKSVRLRRRPGLGSEESINLRSEESINLLYSPPEVVRSSQQSDPLIKSGSDLRICPPPPPIHNRADLNVDLSSSGHSSRYGGNKDFSSCDTARSSKPPSIPSLPSPNSKRRQNLRDQIPISTHSHRMASDDRPALPVKIKKKSQSFRYVREPTPNLDPGNRSPEFFRKAPNDANTYFSLERTKVESYDGVVKPVHARNEASTASPCQQEFKKLAVFPSNETRSVLTKPTALQNAKAEEDDEKDLRPQIPPKKSAQNRTKSGSCENFTSSASPSDISDCQPSNSGKDQRHEDSHKSSISSDSDQSLYDQLPCQARSNHAVPKPYVNARFVRVADPVEGERCIYVPLPSRRKLSGSEKISPDYANYSATDSHRSDLNFSPTLSMNPKSMPGSTTSIDRALSEGNRLEPLMLRSLEDVSVVHDKCYANASFMKSVQELHTVGGALASANKAVCEPINFGEHSDDGSDDDVVEVVNKEIVGERYRSNNPSARPICLPNDDSLRNSLDSIARQVYQDCENYLLHGGNKSEVPSLMPSDSKNSLKRHANSSQEHLPSPRTPTEAPFVTSPSRSSASSLEPQKNQRPADGTSDSYTSEVKNRVSVTPHGLRTRERSNSYRQAVRNVSGSWNKRNFNDGNSTRKDQMAPYIVESPEECQTESPSECSDFESPRKSVHKYETIWFEKIRETSRSDENLRLSRNFADDGKRSSRSNNFVGHPQELDIKNRERNSLAPGNARNDELQPSTNSLERNHISKESPKGNGMSFYASTMKGNSKENLEKIDVPARTTSVSQSTKFGGDQRYLENKEPIYVNTSDLRASTLQHKHLSTVRPSSSRNTSSNNHVSGGLRSPHQENDAFQLIPKPQGPSPTTPTKQNPRTPNTPYMAIPQPKGLGTPPEGVAKPLNFGDHRMRNYEKFLSESGQSRSLPPPPPPTSYKSKNPHTHFPSMERSVPGRPGPVLEPLYNVPVDAKRDHSKWDHTKSSQWDQSKNSQWDHVKNSQWDQSNKSPQWDQFRSPQWEQSKNPQWDQSKISHREHPKNMSKSHSSTNKLESRATQPQHDLPGGGLYSSKAHIVGDIAIVGDSAVRLRRQLRPQDRPTVDQAPPGEYRDPYSVPVAPPRVKRHSSGGPDGVPAGGMMGGVDPGRNDVPSPVMHRRSVINDSTGSTPPALPAKTALHHLLPPPVPPATTSLPAPSAAAPPSSSSSSISSHALSSSCNFVGSSGVRSGERKIDFNGDPSRRCSESVATTSTGSGSDRGSNGSNRAGSNGTGKDNSNSNKDTCGNKKDTGVSNPGSGNGINDTGSNNRNTEGRSNSKISSKGSERPNNSNRNVTTGVKKRGSKEQDHLQLKRQSYHGSNSDHPYYHHHHMMLQHYHSLHHTSSSSSSASSSQSRTNATVSSNESPNERQNNSVYKHVPGKRNPQPSLATGQSNAHVSSTSPAQPNRTYQTRGEVFNNPQSSGTSNKHGSPYAPLSSTPSPHNPGSSNNNLGQSVNNAGQGNNLNSSPNNPSPSPHNTSPGNNTVLSPHSYLQRSLTSSAILVRSADRAGEKEKVSDSPDTPTQKLDFNGPYNGGSSKFSMPGLFKKLRNNVNPKLSPVQPAKQTFVHPNRGAAAGKATLDPSNGDAVVLQNSSDNSNEAQKSASKKKSLKLTSKGNKRSDSIRQKENKKDFSVEGNTDNESQTPIPSSTQTSKGKSAKKNGKADHVLSPGKETKSGISSPTSPKPLARAFGKLKFKRGPGASVGDSDACEGTLSCANTKSSDSNSHMHPLQKSASVGHSMFSSVVQDCGFPRSQKTRLPSASPPPARQQYL